MTTCRFLFDPKVWIICWHFFWISQQPWKRYFKARYHYSFIRMTKYGLNVNVARTQEKLHQFLHHKNRSLRPNLARKLEVWWSRVNVVYVAKRGRKFNIFWREAKIIWWTEYKRCHTHKLKVLVVKWAIDNGLISEGTKWYTENCGKWKVIESNGKKLYWDWEHRIRTNCWKSEDHIWRL